MQKIKLNMEVNLINNRIVGSVALETFVLNIKFLDKDERFEGSMIDRRNCLFTSKNGFKIKYMWDEPYGALREDSILFPRLDKIGFDLKKTFSKDIERYNYLKKLYDALEEWANNWHSFIEDYGYSKIEINNNTWVIKAKNRYDNYDNNYHDKINNIFY